MNVYNDNNMEILQEVESYNQKASDNENGIKFKINLKPRDQIDFMDLQMAESLKKQKKQNFLEEKRRQQLRENTEELKELEMKLRTAYISKGLAAQISEREFLKAKEKEKQNYEIELEEKARIEREESERRREELDKHKKLVLMAELKKQIKQNEHKKTLKIEEYIEEKKIIDNIARKILKEQHEQQKCKSQKRLEIHKDAEEFFRVRQMLEVEKLEAEIEENKKIEALQKERDEYEKKEKEKKLVQLSERQQISENLGKKLNMNERMKCKRMAVLEDLLVEEKAARDEELERKQLAENLKKQMEYRLGLFALLESNKQRAQEQVRQDSLYHNILLEELAKKDQLEKVKEEQKKQKTLLHKQAFLEDLDLKVQLRASELSELLNQRENDIRESQRKEQLIEDERIKMLQEHASVLQGFIPPGVFKRNDKEFLPLSSEANLK
ncbi:meiosis-specific nuclear structural protein 1 isoform X2 [Condylostylus longicornis]|uniref:meiosis-specific nuclear structural protein 1 isoform X2 n=1 Tax=Condylostylus longicornis TaxID=2530218 RepID=UPI00244E5328|nr:meiosis-specific nuclear structural protein 1 isoform X2 [Condylostylus longicornis]